MSAHAHEHTHEHAHSHSHGHAHGHDPERPAFALALTITFGYALVELIGGIWSGSLALTSDAGHMFSDALALGLAAGAAWIARRPPGMKHSYGLARAEVIGASLNGLAMLVIIVVLVVEAVQRLLAPQPVAAGAVMAIAAIGLAVNAALAFVLSRGHNTLNVRGALVHVMGDLLSSIAALIAGAVLLGAAALGALEAARLGDQARAVLIVPLFDAMGLSTGAICAATERIVKNRRWWVAALVTTAPTLLIVGPVAFTLFDGAYAQTLPLLVLAPFVLPPVLWLLREPEPDRERLLA